MLKTRGENYGIKLVIDWGERDIKGPMVMKKNTIKIKLKEQEKN